MADYQDLDEFLAKTHAAVEQFSAWWRKRGAEDIDNFPQFMSEADWDEQFLMFMESSERD